MHIIIPDTPSNKKHMNEKNISFACKETNNPSLPLTTTGFSAAIEIKIIVPINPKTAKIIPVINFFIYKKPPITSHHITSTTYFLSILYHFYKLIESTNMECICKLLQWGIV